MEFHLTMGIDASIFLDLPTTSYPYYYAMGSCDKWSCMKNMLFRHDGFVASIAPHDAQSSSISMLLLVGQLAFPRIMFV
jgi:hypothetical protein